jgi:hypothetical protein
MAGIRGGLFGDASWSEGCGLLRDLICAVNSSMRLMRSAKSSLCEASDTSLALPSCEISVHGPYLTVLEHSLTRQASASWPCVP